MSNPFTESILGSWLFIRSTEPIFTPRVVYHFTANGKNFWEVDYEEKRLLSPVNYRFSGNTLTLIFSDSTERDFRLTVEDDGSVHVPNPTGISGWMVKLAKPEPYSKAFVDEHGQLQKL